MNNSQKSLLLGAVLGFALGVGSTKSFYKKPKENLVKVPTEEVRKVNENKLEEYLKKAKIINGFPFPRDYLIPQKNDGTQYNFNKSYLIR